MLYNMFSNFSFTRKDTTPKPPSTAPSTPPSTAPSTSRPPLERQNAFSSLDTSPSFMDKKDINSPFVKVLVEVDSSKGSEQPNLFEVKIDDGTTGWDDLNELMTKCDLYLITPDTPSRALKITLFAPNEQEDKKLYKIKVESTDGYRSDNLYETPKSITGKGFKIYRTFRFIKVTDVVQRVLQAEGSSSKDNYVGYEYVKIEPESEEALVTRGTTVLQALKDNVNNLGERIKVGKLLAERKSDNKIFDALFDFNKTDLVFDIKPIGLEKMVTDAGKNVEQGINAGIDSARVGISNVVNLSEQANELTKGIQTSNLASVDTANQEEGYYKDLDPAAFFDKFHLIIRNDSGQGVLGLFGGKRRTRRSKKSNKNKRKNKKTNKRRRR